MNNHKIIAPFEEIFSLENLFKAFNDFKNGKEYKKDVSLFSVRLFDNLILLHKELLSDNYVHGKYTYFKINDPKSRDIHKASVRDRVVHHSIYNAIYGFFDNKFIDDSYSCRVNKGTHKALNKFQKIIKNEIFFNQKVYILKCDIRKCFASVDHHILKSILGRHIICHRFTKVLNSIIDSFSSENIGKGIPLGNLTSQLFINIYLNELDIYIKKDLRVKNYIRYADDFVIIGKNEDKLKNIADKINLFLFSRLKMNLHIDKVFIKNISKGVDFLGFVHFNRYRVLRTKTKRIILKKVKNSTNKKQVDSYIGFIGHGNSFKLKKKIEKLIMV